MRPLRCSINVTLDGCCDHREVLADEDLLRHGAENIERADAILFGRVTYEMMESYWRPLARPQNQQMHFGRQDEAVAGKLRPPLAVPRRHWSANQSRPSRLQCARFRLVLRALATKREIARFVYI